VRHTPTCSSHSQIPATFRTIIMELRACLSRHTLDGRHAGRQAGKQALGQANKGKQDKASQGVIQATTLTIISVNDGGST
jgi:hypothetical protein